MCGGCSHNRMIGVVCQRDSGERVEPSGKMNVADCPDG